MIRRAFVLFSCLLALILSAPAQTYDVIIRGGTLYDGSGRRGVRSDLAINGDTIAAIGDLAKATGKTEVNAKGKAVSPGFINMLSWASGTLFRDGRAQSDLRQGVTLEVFGEGSSLGPVSAAMKKDRNYANTTWTTFGEAMETLEKRGISVNIASFLGATTVRIHEVGYADRTPTPEEMDRMKELVRQSMREGALGIGSSLIYAPAFYAKTEELVALCEAAAPFGGMYISHMRSEGARLLESIGELIEIARRAKVPAEIFHLKAAGKNNWGKLNDAIRMIESARAAGIRVTADMYTYTAGATGLNASMPPWVQEGGHDEWVKRLRDPQIRERVAMEMAKPTDEWENLGYDATPEGTLLLDFRKPALRSYIGKTLAAVAKERGVSPQIAAMDLVVEDDSRVGAAYFLMSEENVRRQIKLPYMSFGSDGGAPSAEGFFLQSSTHPRAYGNFARLLGRYVRDEKLIPLEEAIRRLSALPASNLKLKKRGELKQGYFADVVVFDPATIRDHATFEKPHQYSTGVEQVFVNGQQVLKNGEPTGARAGRFIRGSGYGMN